jgi:hypothetical protein
VIGDADGGGVAVETKPFVGFGVLEMFRDVHGLFSLPRIEA